MVDYTVRKRKTAPLSLSYTEGGLHTLCVQEQMCPAEVIKV